ncbi:MAG: PepSY-associated TM helix domain-containing protein [Sphingomonadaceae bacterium]
MTFNPDGTARRLAQRRSLFWRVHFWAALLTSPLVLVALLTGILYIFTPQIEQVLYRHLDRVVPGGAMQSLDRVVAVADASAPMMMRLKSVQPPADAGASVLLVYGPDAAAAAAHDGHAAMLPKGAQAPVAIYIDPYTLRVLGSMAVDDRFKLWAQRLHSRLLQGEGWRWLIELAASWMMVMLLTGVYLWWPRGTQRGLPQAGARGRNAWRQWHAFLGVALGLVSLIILLTGLTWSQRAGDQIQRLAEWSGQATQAAPRDYTSTVLTGHVPIGYQRAWELARQQAPQVAMQLTPPAGETGVWRIQSIDHSQPGQRFKLMLDSFTGERLYFAGWDSEKTFGKATALGIPFHRGEFGWWNQALLLVFGLSVLFSLVSGWVMFFKRRKPGAGWLPKLLPGAWRSASAPMLLTTAALCALMPLLAVSAALVALVEWYLARLASSATVS